VEARPRNVDELYYAAQIVARHWETDDFGKTTISYIVQYDDGDIEDRLLESSLLRYNRRLIWQGDKALVEDGTILVNGKIRRVRLLQFGESLGIYQSGMLLSSTLPNRIDFSLLPFEVNQAMALGIAMHNIVSNRRKIRKACFAGLGGGAVPSFFHYLVPSAEVIALEACGEVVWVARRFFGLDNKIQVFEGDAFEWFLQSVVDFDLVVVDVADASDRFLPPRRFLDSRLIKHIARANNAVIVMNTLPSRDAPSHSFEMANAFSGAFPHTSYSVTVDPNRVFFACNAGLEEDIAASALLEAIDNVPKLRAGIPGIAQSLSLLKDSMWKKIEA
jgi:hypothetical protein